MSDYLQNKQSSQAVLKGNYSSRLLDALARVGQRLEQPLYIVGGTVRDYLLGRASNDLDITVQNDPYYCAALLIEEMGAGTIVPLARGAEAAARVMVAKEQVDFSAFRGGKLSIEDDLHLRDFTVNAMAMDFASLYGKAEPILIDPTGGKKDLQMGLVRHLPAAFVDDPARLLRGYRLCAVFGFQLDPGTRKEISRRASTIETVAVERVSHELQLIFGSPRTAITLAMMAEDGLLQFLLPELYEGDGVEQPEFHHLDVFGHCFLALKMMEDIIAKPMDYYPEYGELLVDYVKAPRLVRGLKWAALLHDVGKPATRAVPDEKGGRVTFYGHDEVGRRIFNSYAKKAKWSQVESGLVGDLIGMHMHPFHLCNVVRSEALSPRAALKLSQRAGENLVGLFLLAMADSLASEGEKKPKDMEKELTSLFSVVQEIYVQRIEPVTKGPKLITGYDLIKGFGLTPGPEFSRIMSELEIARVDGVVTDRSEALAWIKQFLRRDAVGGNKD
ncbi:MAG: polynucleotide adenylyltransferase [Desulfotalea sp.]|nr:MAG: polynucleotide adenylyltransferase [Desulfotalea sp.]